MATPNFPAIEDWTPPWGDGEFDADKARGLIYNLSKDKAQAESTIVHLRGQATKMKSDLEAAQAASKDAENVKTESEVLRDDAIYGRKVKAAIEKGIDPAKAGWLSGDTPEELAKSAEQFVKDFGTSAPEAKDEGAGDDKGGDPPEDKGEGQGEQPGSDPVSDWFARRSPVPTLTMGAMTGTDGSHGNPRPAETFEDAKKIISKR